MNDDDAPTALCILLNTYGMSFILRTRTGLIANHTLHDRHVNMILMIDCANCTVRFLQFHDTQNNKETKTLTTRKSTNVKLHFLTHYRHAFV